MREEFNEFLIDEKLGIRTTGRNDEFADSFRYPYEPTTYSVLDRVAEEGYITQDDYLVDYGSGKGRVPIYMNYLTGCRAIGIELVQDFVDISNKNIRAYGKTGIEFVCEQAEKWGVADDATCFFFFNPFSIKIMLRVMNKIIDSYYRRNRNIKLFFYYPSDEYIAYFSTIHEMQFVDEIDCMDLFDEKDVRNRVMIFEIIYTY